MSIAKVFSKKAKKGFTIVELLIIAPIVILVIGAFISVIVNMTGEVLMARGANSMAYNIQDSLNRIEADVKLSTTFLSTNNVALNMPQGYNDVTDAFHNVSTTNSDELILNTLATTGNPLATTSGIVYLANQPNACNSTQVSQNTPLTLNVIYFIKNNTLWRRVVMPSNYKTAGCSVPWQQPSCNPAIISSPTPQTMCQAQDERLMDNINPGDLDIQYFTSANTNTADTASTNTSNTDAQRGISLQADTTVIASINTTNIIAGHSVTQSGSIRATKLDVNASTIAVVTPPTATPVAPTVTATLSIPDKIIFSWGRVATSTSYTINYSIAGGSYVAGATNQNITSYTVSGASRGQSVCATVYANNSVGSSPFGSACATIPNWYGLTYQNAWSDYNGGYATGAYTKTVTGVVVLKGLLVRAGTPTAGEAIAVLPPGYRPSENYMFMVGGVGAADRLDIHTDGTIVYETGSASFLSLDGVAFMPAASWTNVTPINGWYNYDSTPPPGGFAVAGYAIDSLGLVFIKGLVKNGTTTTETPIINVPAGFQSGEYLHQPTTSNNSFDVTGISTSGGILTKGINQNTYRSIQHIYYASGRATWTNLPLQNSWVPYPNFSAPQYTKGTDGIVKVKGLIQSGNTASGAVIANLPSGYRPAATSLQSGACYLIYCRFDVQSNGDIVARDNVSAGWSSLDDITFIAEQ